MVDKLFTPDLGVASAATLQQDHDRRAFKASCNIARVHALAHDLCKLREDFLGLDDADLCRESRQSCQA